MIPQLTNPKINDTASRLASALLGNLRDTEFAYDDLALFGAPSECGLLIGQSHNKQIERILKELNITAAEAHKLICACVDGHWLHFIGCDIDTDLAEIAESEGAMRYDWEAKDWVYL